MSDLHSQEMTSQRFFGLITLLAVVFALGFAGTLIGSIDQSSAASGSRVVLGATKDRVTPNCGIHAVKRACIAEGNVTGFQSLQKGTRGRSFVVPYRRGKVIAWSISLSNPTRKASKKFGGAQQPYFNKLFGSPSKAKISILRQVRKNQKGPPQYRLIRGSGIQTLNPYFGTTVKFALIKPLNVARGDIVALTIPTWAPAFWVPYACNADRNQNLINPTRCAKAKRANTWRASRNSKQCGIGTDDFDRPNEALRKSNPQAKNGSIRRYGCYYDGGRLLYTATVVAR